MFTVDTGSGLGKLPLAGMDFTNSASSLGSVAQGLNGINVGAVAGASVQSAGAFDIAMYAALMVFLLGSLYLLHEKRLV